MIKNRNTVIQVVVAAAALLVGTALGRWVASGPTPATTAPAVVAATPAQSLAAVSTSSKVDSATEKKETAAAAARFNKTLAEIMKSHDPRTRTKDLEEFAKQIATTDIGAALKQLGKMPDNTTRELAMRLLAAKWVESDPEGALKFATENKDFDYLASDVMQQMAASDLQGALARAQQITDANTRYQAFRGILSFMADNDPMGALQLASSLGNFPGQEPLNNMIYKQWAQVDPQAAALAAAQAQQNGQGGDGWRSPVGQVLRNWASQDPLSALGWATAQADPSRDVGQIMRQWSRDDLNGAANWVNGQPVGAVRDAAAASLAMSVGWNDPSAGINWAMSISDPGSRDAALERLSREIMFRNPNDGANILTAAGVPPNLIPPPPGQGGGPGGGGRGGGRRGGGP